MVSVSLLVVFLMGLLSYDNIQAIRQVNEQQEISHGVQSLNAELLSLLKDAETGQRGFLLSGEDRYLEPYNNALAAIPELVKRFRAQVIPRPDQAARLRLLEPLVTSKLDELGETISLYRSGKKAEALALMNAGRGKTLMDEIRATGGEIDQVAKIRLARFAAEQERSAARLRLFSILGSVVLLSFLILSAIIIFRGMNRRDALYKQAYAAQKILTTTLVGIADAVIATDAEGKVTFINPVAQSLTGWTEQECQGKFIADVVSIVDENTRLAVTNPLEKALVEGRSQALANSTNLIAKDGRETPIDDSAAPLRDQQGNLIGAVLVFRDISARRKAERQARQAAAALKTANEELEQFVNAAAHDLRSPLNSVNAIAQLMAREFTGQLGPKGDELIGLITNGVARMRRLLDDLLAYAHEGHLQVARAGPVSMSAAFRSALENLKAETESTGAEVTCGPLPVVPMHEAQLLQLFQNLIGNALKYHSAQPPSIHVSATEEGDTWLISVADNGIGIAPEYAEQIFQPFKRLHGDEYPGTGIGLATCQKIIRSYGGRIWVESQPGKGSIFFFTVPVARSEGACSAATPSSS